MKFYKNQTSCDCAVVGVLNCLKIVGKKVSLNDWSEIADLVGLMPTGTPWCNVSHAFNFWNVSYAFDGNLYHSADIDKYLDAGYAVFLCFPRERKQKKWAHCCVITDRTKNHYTCINNAQQKPTAVSKIRRKTLQRYFIRLKKPSCFASAYIIKKKDAHI